MIMKKIITVLSVLLICLTAAACRQGEKTVLPDGSTSDEVTTDTENNGDYDFDLDTSDEGAEEIDLSSLTPQDGYFTLSGGGKYLLRGKLEGGIKIEAAKDEKVHLILDGADIKNDIGAALYIVSADKTVITLREGSENYLSDGESYVTRNGTEPNACLFSKDDLTINGSGKLSIYAKCNNGIGSKDDLKIFYTELSVIAPKNALKGSESVRITDSTVKLSGCKDGIKSDNESKDGKGYIAIEGGTLSVNCYDDGLQAFRSVSVHGCDMSIEAGDKKISCGGAVNIGENIS